MLRWSSRTEQSPPARHGLSVGRHGALESRIMNYLVPEELEHRPLVVVGGGTLGRRIALMQARAGAEVRVVDRSRKALEEAKAYIESELPLLIPEPDKRPGILSFGE